MDAASLLITLSAIDNVSPVIKQVESSTSSLGNTFQKVTQNTLGFAAGIAAVAGIGSVMDALGGVVVGFNSKLEQSTISWKTFTGSTDAAAAVLTQIQQIAATTPFTFADVDSAAKRFVNVGFSAQQALDFITPLSNAVASVGLGAAGVDRVSLALAQMTSKTKVQGDEMLQLTEAQIPAWDILAQATGKPIPELQKLVTAGKVSAKEFTDAFASFYGDTGKFADAAHDQSLTLQGSLSTIKDELNIVGSTAFQPLFKALSDGARALAAFVQSDQFTVWGAKVQAVVGLVVDGLGGLASAFGTTLGGVLNIVNTLGQAIYQGLQWINPFASHSPPLVSQVQDGVAAIQTSYESLSGLTETFAGIGTAFEALGDKTAAFSDTVDGTTLKTQAALAVMGPGVTAAFNEASDAVDAAKVSLSDIKEAWDQATDALAPLKDNLGATKDALQAQQDTLSDLKLSLADAKAAFDPLNDALKDAKQNASDAESAIKSLTNVPVAGTADFDKKISDANIALKQQALLLSNVKNSSGYLQLGDQIDAATAKLKEMQRAQSAVPTLPAGATAAQRAAATAAANDARAAISDQQVGIDALKAKQAELIGPAQKKLDLDRNTLDTINLQKDATIGVANEQIKQAALMAQGIKEQTQAQIQAGIAAAGAAKTAADAQVDKLTPQVKAQQAVVDGLTAKILDQQHAVDAAQKATDAANKTYSDAKEKVDDLGTAYRDTKQQVAAYEQQLKSTITVGDTQVQKIKAAAAAAKKAAADAGTGPSAPKTDVLAGLDIAGSQAKIKAFSDQVASTRASVTGNLDALGNKWATIWSTVKSVLDRVLVSFGGFQAVQPAIDFLQRFAGVAAGLGAALVIASPLVGFFISALAPVGALVAAVLTPIGLLVVGIAALTAAWTLNIGNIQQSASGLATAFEPLQALPAIVDKALSGDVLGALSDFVNAVGDVRNRLIETVAGWAGAFLDWAIPLLPALLGQIEQIGTALTSWVIGYGTKLVANVLKWGDAFVGWVLPRIPLILNTLETLATSLFGWVKTIVPRLINAVGQWATAFVQWVIPLQPQLLTSLELIANRIIQWIRDGVPELLGAFVDWAGAFIGWIAPLIPPLLGELATLLGEIIRWAVEEGLPAIVGAIGDWGKAFIGWVAPRISPMLAELAAIGEALLGWVKDRLPDIIAEVEKWGAAFVDWIGTTVLPALGPALDTIINGGNGFIGILPWIKAAADGFPEAFGYWATKFILWLDDVRQQLPPAIDKMVADLSPGMQKSAEPIGAAILQGIVLGITQAIPAFETAVNNAIWGSLGKIKDGAVKAIEDATSDKTGVTAPHNVPTSSDSLTSPIIGQGLNIAKGAAPITDAQFGAAVKAMGFTAAEIESICGPIAAQGMADALSGSVGNLKTLVKSAQASGLGDFSGDVGTFGNAGEIGILKQAGVDATTVSEAEAEALAAQGIPVIINTAKHFWAAQGFDANTGKFDVGATNVFPQATGGGRNLTLGQISGAGGGVQGFIAPTAAVGRRASSAADVARRAATAAAPVVDANLPGLSDILSPVGNDIPKGSDAVGAQFTKIILDAQNFASQFGISITAANDILLDHGSVAKTVLGTDVPSSIDVTDKAVEGFADSFGISWDQARAILTAGGDVATAVMGQQIPSAVQTTVDAVGSAGDPALWDLIRGNAADTGRDLSKYLKDIGAPAIDLATASLSDLVKASGLSLPQVQKQAGAAGKDIRAWLLTVGVPAADALRDSLSGTNGLAAAADGLKQPVDDATGAVGAFKKPADDAKSAVGDLGGAMGEVATNQATQIAAVLLDLRDGLLGIGKHSEGGLIQAVKDFASALAGIHDVAVTVTTNYVSNGSPGGGSSVSSSSNSGGSGPGGVNDQARQNAANAAAVIAATSTLSRGGVGNTGGGGQLINSSTPGAGRTNPNQFAVGGWVPGPIGAPLPAIIHGGEYVIPAAMASAITHLPSAQTIFQTTQTLGRIQAQFNTLPKSVQVKAQIQPSSSGTLPVATLQQHVARPTTGGAGSGGINEDSLAAKIAAHMARAMQNAPAPKVSVEEIRSALIRVGGRNSGTVGLA